MCGIAGIFSYTDNGPPIDLKHLIKMMDQMVQINNNLF